MPFAEMKKGKIFYEVHGDKQPLMLIAGLGRDSSQWADFVEDLQRSFQVILIDNPASGQSSWKGDLTLQEMAEAAIVVLDELKIKKCHIIGHSMGGFIGQIMAAFYPDRVATLALFGSPAVPSRGSFIMSDIVKDLKACKVPLITIGKCLGAFGIGMKTLLEEGMLEKFIEDMGKTAYPMSDEQQLLQIKACMAQDSRNYLNKIKAYTLICTGDEDKFAPPIAMELLYEQIEHSDVVILKGVGHMIQLEAPKEFLSLAHSLANTAITIP
jgi:pimeloyl-ACP methyl ester carboxylesterase